MIVYYSHPKTYKNSAESEQDIGLLEALGYGVISPYDPKFSDLWQEEGIKFGKVLVDMCDYVAFRPLSNGKIGAGVGKELGWAIELQKPILEMPSAFPFDENTLKERLLSIDETVEFFNTIGK